ncbi:uncharacterized protein LOC132554698 [Ylistrum balloti]|uniref:uncharacterized protein LOC132554698 n=1 Tax=Ylistrum balloti TaxID=509963 RepID=UPI0029058E3E|nr:uncharacterized protein LOC132554698 [Ylistrum balloti]
MRTVCQTLRDILGSVVLKYLSQVRPESGNVLNERDPRLAAAGIKAMPSQLHPSSAEYSFDGIFLEFSEIHRHLGVTLKAKGRCRGGDLCYDSIEEKYNYCSGYCCGKGDECCTKDVGGLVGVAIAITVGIIAIIVFSVCICCMFAKTSRDSARMRTSAIHPRNLDDSFKHTTSVSYTTTTTSCPSCQNRYQNGVFTYTLPASFHLTRECPSLSLSPISPPPPMSPIYPPPYDERSESPPKYLSD